MFRIPRMGDEKYFQIDNKFPSFEIQLVSSDYPYIVRKLVVWNGLMKLNSSFGIVYKFIILFSFVFIFNCGLALEYQSEQAAKSASGDDNSNAILAALGLSEGGGSGSSGILGFNPNTLSFSAASGKGLYTITLASWPGGGTAVVGLNLGAQAAPGGTSGDFTFGIQWTGSSSCLAPSQTYMVASDDIFPLTLGGGGISFSCGIVTSGLFKHVIISSNGTALPVGTDIGDLQVNVTP
ncbi:hypothetical protein [Leptospira haakeii]|uniref:Uncharacterized protein n=1 Tax=Leptospira haakeii TaxID=2023198 RepID=A0ABX4PLU1_9LEPT|nr:hypothetical protein [Leptospira haakeii]PKA16563.1 hypothetical protein CH363_07255 [Leptospira haakeii]PKA20584.1 hypothetical protein CH377_06660 [Leptospira haakeii]